MANPIKLLLLAPSYFGLYEDIRQGLEFLNIEVEWVQDCQIESNPYNKHDINRKIKSVEEYNREVEAFWKVFFDSHKKEMSFDYFLAIDGLMVCPAFFALLKQNNPGIKSSLYLYDSVAGNYEIDQLFKFYDKVFTFDQADARIYNISHLPYFWLASPEEMEVKYDVFGMGSYKDTRYKVFSMVKQLAIEAGLSENIHLWFPPVQNKLIYQLKHLLTGKKPPLSKLKEEIFTDRTLPLNEFRRCIFQSKAVIDTNYEYQEGLTARFMWSLSAGKKIIMTNAAVTQYEFYTPEQIMVLDGDYDKVVDFITAPFTMSEKVKTMILKYRIDNWLKTVLSLD